MSTSPSGERPRPDRLHGMEVTKTDRVRLTALCGVAALAVSLGVGPGLAFEIAGALAGLLGIAILLRPETRPPAPSPPPPAPSALEQAAASVRAARSGSLGVEGGLRRSLRRSVAARRRLQDQPVDHVLDGLPPDLRAVLARRWEHDRGLTEDELDDLLTAVEGMTP